VKVPNKKTGKNFKSPTSLIRLNNRKPNKIFHFA